MSRKGSFLTGKFFTHGRFFWLLISLVLSLIVSTFLHQHIFFQWTSTLVLLFILIAAILTVKESYRFVIFLIIIAVLSIFFNISNLIAANTFNQFSAKLFLAFFCILLIACFGKDILKTKKVTVDLFFGAICIYLLIAITFGLLYHMINILDPQSFYMLSSGIRVSPTEFDFFYFSFTTLTTVGYGDVAIVTAHAKALVVVESISGIFYLAILVSRLVARHGKN
jgi:hypothetical protein